MEDGILMKEIFDGWITKITSKKQRETLTKCNKGSLTFSRTLWRIYGGAKGLVISKWPQRPRRRPAPVQEAADDHRREEVAADVAARVADALHGACNVQGMVRI